MVDPNELWPFQLSRGASKRPPEGACLLDAVSWFEYGCLGDRPPCVSPVLAVIGHAANDWSSDEQRQELRRFIPLLPGTAGDDEADRRRADYLAFGFAKLRETWERRIAEHFKSAWFREIVRSVRAPLPQAYVEIDHWAPEDCSSWSAASPDARHALRYLRTATKLKNFAVDVYRKEATMPQFPMTIMPQDLALPIMPGSVTIRTISFADALWDWVVDALDVGCAIGRKADAPVRFDFGGAPLKVREFQRARETV